LMISRLILCLIIRIPALVLVIRLLRDLIIIISLSLGGLTILSLIHRWVLLMIVLTLWWWLPSTLRLVRLHTLDQINN
jgi:hypothetical protein